jgi:hypothetical protein
VPNFNGLFSIYEMKQILSYFSETNRPFGLYLLEKFHMCVTVTRGQSRFNHLLHAEEEKAAVAGTGGGSGGSNGAIASNIAGSNPTSALMAGNATLASTTLAVKTSSNGGGDSQSIAPTLESISSSKKQKKQRRTNTIGNLIPNFSDLYFYFSGALPETMPPKKQKNAAEFKAIRRLEKEGKIVTLQRIFRLTIFSTALYVLGGARVCLYCC